MEFPCRRCCSLQYVSLKKQTSSNLAHWTKKGICSNLPMSKDVVNMIANLEQISSATFKKKMKLPSKNLKT